MVEVSGKEAQVVEALESGEQNMPERYSGGPELEAGSFSDLKDEELVTLYGTLSDVPAKEIAGALDVTSATISNYRSRLVDEGYLRNLQPGRGPGDYRPGIETLEMMDNPPQPDLLDADPARPLDGDEEGLDWLIGGSLYSKIYGDEGYQDLSENEARALEMTLNSWERPEIAETLEVTPRTVSNYRSKLVDKDYLRDLNGGRGPGNYLPGWRAIQVWEDYSPEINFLSADPSRPFQEEKGLRWLIGEELYELVVEEGSIEEESEVSKEEVADIDLNGHSKQAAVRFLDLVGEGENGFGVIADRLDGNAYEISDLMEEEGFLEEDSSISGLRLSEKGEKYLENNRDVLDREEDAGRVFRTNSKSSGRRSTRSSSRTRRNGGGKADEELQEIGEKLLGGHVEKKSQEDRVGIDSRDMADSEEEDLDMDDNQAGYEGFT